MRCAGYQTPRVHTHVQLGAAVTTDCMPAPQAFHAKALMLTARLLCRNHGRHLPAATAFGVRYLQHIP